MQHTRGLTTTESFNDVLESFDLMNTPNGPTTAVNVINQSINQITFISESPVAVSFAALREDGLVSVQRVRDAECDRSLMIVVGDVQKECLDTTSKCLDGCRRTREWW